VLREVDLEELSALRVRLVKELIRQKRLSQAFVLGHLMVVSDEVSYSDLFALAAEAERRLGRKVNPTVYTPAELRQKLAAKNAFATRVLELPKAFVIGSENDLRESRKSRKNKPPQG